MAKTGLDQMDRPAPLFYRRFTNAMIIFIIPAAVLLVQGWGGLSDRALNRWMLILAFIPPLIKGVGVMIGNGSYIEENKNDKP